MRKMLFLVLLLPSFVFSADEVLQFESPKQAERYRNLIHELRCPKCLNQSIADSDAGISEDLRNIVYEKMMEGQSNEQIKQFLKQRYGDFILYQPETSGANLILWFGPALLLIIALVWLISRIKQNENAGDAELSEEETDKLKQLLNNDDNNNERAH